MPHSTSPDNDAGYFHSLNCVDVWIDEPGDRTVRPIPPERLEQAKAERDRMRAYEKTDANVQVEDA
jgi:hypothetical protein